MRVATATTAALGVLLSVHLATAQTDSPPPGDPTLTTTSPPPVGSDPPPMSSSPSTQGSQMDFGSAGSDGASDGSSGSSWFPMPTVSTGDWGLNWTWKGSLSDDSSSSSSMNYSPPTEATAGSGYYDDEVGTEVYIAGIDGDLAAAKRDKYVFDANQGFAVNATVGGVKPGNCSYAYCMHFVFESDYGAMTPFDAFVLDRYESAGGPVGFSQGDWVGGPVPLVLGSMSNETLQRLGSNWGSVLNWNESRRTTWTLHSNSIRPDEIDLTLSLRQLYTFLPGYPGNNISSNGPFFSADLSDQVIIRVSAQVASAFAGASATLPVLVNHTGSQLVDIDLTSSLLYEGNGVSGGNEIQLTFKLTRRKYGGTLPWYPATASPECKQCQEMDSDTFAECLDQRVGSFNAILDDLLSFQNERTSFDIEPFAEACFAEMLKNATDPSLTMPTTSTSSYWNGTDWVYFPMPVADGWRDLRNVDAMLRCWTESHCNMEAETIKADGQVVVLHHEPARTRFDFGTPQYSFYLQLALEDAPSNEAITTQVMNSEMTAENMSYAISSVFPNADKLKLDIEVLKYNNTDEIEEINRQNQWLMDEYNRALEWMGSASSSEGSNGDDAGSSGSSGTSAGSAGAVRPRYPTLQAVPTPVFTVEIIAHNITVVPHVKEIYSSDLRWQNSVDNSLRLQVAPLNVSKFEYVPPGPSVDLEWRDEPEWMTQVRRFLPNFPSNDSCSQCVDELEACVFDEDCAYGVNTYLADALSWNRLSDKITTKDYWNFGQQWTNLSVDATETLRQARMFFPSRGWSKLEGLFQCLSESQCNVDERRYQESNSTMMQWTEAPPTLVMYEGAETDIIADYNETVYIWNGPSMYQYSVDGNASAFEEFLRDVVFRWDPQSVRNMHVQPRYDTTSGGTLPPGTVRYSISWSTATSPMSVSTSHATSYSSSSSGKMEISTSRTTAYASYHWKDVQWQRLESWLSIFRMVPFGYTTGGSINGTGTSNFTSNWTTTNNWNWNNTNNASGWNGDWSTVWNSNNTNTTQPTVCPPCAGLLMGCLQDPSCDAAAHLWLATVRSSPTLETDGFIHTRWDEIALTTNMWYGSSVIMPVHKTKLLEIFDCMTRYKCAVGYSKASNDSVIVPTTVALTAKRDVNIPVGTNFKLLFQQYEAWNVSSTSNLDSIVTSIDSIYGEKISVVRSSSWDSTHDIFTFSGSYYALSELQVVETPSSAYISDVSYAGAFLTPAQATPSWEGLTSWVDQSNPFAVTNTVDDPLCSACLPKFQACYDNHECWRSVQDFFVPLLQGKSPYYPFMSWWTSWSADQKDYLYTLSLDYPIQNQLVNPPTRSFFTTDESFRAFTNILRCIAASRCDLETMESAALPPATAHVPTFLKFTPQRILVMLIKGNTMQMTVNGQVFSYDETGSGSTIGLEAYMNNTFGVRELPFNITLKVLEGPPAGFGYQYDIIFPGDFFGKQPDSWTVLGDRTLTVGGMGFGGGSMFWQLGMESVNQAPEWDKFLSLFSFTPPTGVVNSTISTQPTPPYLDNCINAESYRRWCYQDFTCRYLLNAYAIPALATALQSPAPYNPASNLFEIDLTAALTTQIMWKAGASDSSKTKLMRMIYETTLCVATSTSSSRPTFQNARIQFTRPARGPLQLQYQGNTSSVHDENSPDGMSSFLDFFYENVIATSVGEPGSMLRLWGDDGQNVTYDVELIGVYQSPMPHLFWNDTMTGERLDSTDSPWRLSFQSPIYNLYNEAQGWLAWLGASPSP